MSPTDQDKVKVAREYFMRADEGRPDILELFHEDAESIFQIRNWIGTGIVFQNG
jgi:hypothetical protein